MRSLNSDGPDRKLQDIFTEGYELVLYWDKQKWDSSIFIKSCWTYHVIDEINSMELEIKAKDNGSVVLSKGSASEMNTYSMLWNIKGFISRVRLIESWL